MVLSFNIIPEFIHLTLWKIRVRVDIMKGNDPPLPHKWTLHLKILFNALVGMISINKEEINRLSLE